jgi:hypothetical protein
MAPSMVSGSYTGMVDGGEIGDMVRFVRLGLSGVLYRKEEVRFLLTVFN